MPISLSYYLVQYEFLWNRETLYLFEWYCLYYGIPYFAIATLIFSLGYILSRSDHSCKIQKVSPRRWQIPREVLLSLLTVAIFGVVAIYRFATGRVHAETLMYSDFSEHGWLYLLASLPLLIAAHDTYFYWTHRLMHFPSLFPILHRAHHTSKTPTAWTAYTFHPGEAVTHALYICLFTAILPIHWLVFTVFMLHMIVRVVLIHCGVEMMPLRTVNHPILKWFTTTTHHDLHHAKGTGNYGLYFTWWDRLMGTERSDYLTEFRRHARPVSASASKFERVSRG